MNTNAFVKHLHLIQNATDPQPPQAKPLRCPRENFYIPGAICKIHYATTLIWRWTDLKYRVIVNNSKRHTNR